MIKCTILYKNGKTWNVKAKYFSDVSAVDCLCVIFREGDTVYATAPYHHMVTGWHWNTPEFVGYSLTGYTRTPNPKSKTKKQKAFDEAYRRWIRDWHERGSADITAQAYKKWLYEQRKSPAIKCFPSFSVGGKIGYYPQGSDEIVWCTITEAKYTPPNDVKITAMLPSDISKVDTQIKLSYEEPNGGWITWNGGEMPVGGNEKVQIKQRNGYEDEAYAKQFDWVHAAQDGSGLKHLDVIAYKVHEEETSPSEPRKITFPSGATISWDGVYKPWKESVIGKFHKQVEELQQCMAEAETTIPERFTVLCNEPTWKELGLGDRTKPIKTTYTFWLGANGEVVDEM